MIKEFISLFQKDGLLEQALNDSHVMLADVESMVRAANQALRHSDGAELAVDVGRMDKAVNRYESEVRRKVFTHLTVMGTEKVYPALVLVSIIIDIERVGDYAKNIVDLAREYTPRLKGGPFEEEVARIEDAVIEHLLPEGRIAFEKNNVNQATELIRNLRWVNPTCDRITKILCSGKQKSDMTPENQVALALYARYLKRINSHWQNVLTSVVNPFDRIGFRKDF